jgi:hypothetical protein
VSLLTPLYVLGLLAVSLPIVFHLIRRAPRGDFEFSSLMFLSPSPPRMTRRSRLDHILLLLLRGLVVALLAFAFTRPFWRQAEPADLTNSERERVAIVVDTSASMRRGNLWQQAVDAVDDALAERAPHDQVAVFTCDDTLRPLINFDDMSKLEPGQRRSMVKQQLSSAGPSWAGTHLGRGLLDAIEILGSVPEPEGQVGGSARRIILITDFQQGSRVDELGAYQWPADVTVDLRTLAASQRSNAGLQLLADGAPADNAGEVSELRVNVYNDADSSTDEFKLAWLDPRDQPLGPPIDVYVPAGESRVVRVPPPVGVPLTGQRLRLRGDECEFDNLLYFAARPHSELAVIYLGAEAANDPSGLRYYLERVLTDSGMRSMTLKSAAAGDQLKLDSPLLTPLVVISAEPSPEQVESLATHVEAGGTVLWVVQQAGDSAGLSKLLGVSSAQAEEATVASYTMLGQIEFDHPLFAAMAGPQFNDFTQIYFWKYRRLALPKSDEIGVVARFENGDPAVLERRVGQGQVVVFTSGWQPADSQLARSWKFVLLVSALVDGRRARLSDRAFFIVNESVPIRQGEKLAGELGVTRPDGTKVLLTDDDRTFSDTGQPGVYALSAGDRSETIAVNLDWVESRTSPLPADTLRQFGARLANSAAVVENDEQRRQLRDAQLESRQKLWQWLIVAAFGMAIAETWLAGRITKTSPAIMESV